MRLERQAFEEVNVSGFSHIDQEVAFFTQIAALVRADDFVLDFGAGRGEFFYDEPSRYRLWLQNFRGRVAHVDGCDIDPAVLGNPTLDEAKLLEKGQPLPYEDERFDIVVSRYVFEHVSDPEWLARELLRVTKPGGWICALTPNKWGYVALASRLFPNRVHSRLLRSVQPHRKEEDVFPTAYKLNRPKDVRRFFSGGADVFHYTTSAVPSYHFGSYFVFRATLLLHRVLPPILDLVLGLFIRKHERSRDS
ncbi:class I SAM-dependent methyltransferase [Sphingomonas sp.]|uniref:class I SAM-dependent methyltransferase n=1 Tax=Sphingomonas sp. TaxID=28214 RepID=UPI0017FFBEF4|nr:class I SAM-dependent methyltransferase [Sphingomonas sp.]MBA3511517.1 class I SAM-dependent methyltransferase [Sphingomonas sp.]